MENLDIPSEPIPPCRNCGSTTGFTARRHFVYTNGELFEDCWVECQSCGKKTTLEELA
jgi:hypothetical protein